MVDVQGKIVAILNGITGLTAWRNRLPAGFTNTSPAVTVTIENDAHHVTGSTRSVLISCRIYGGSSKLADVRSTYDSVVDALRMYNDSDIAITGAFTGQELPPEPETGWPGYDFRFDARIKE